MAIAFVQSGSAGASGALSISKAFPSPNTAGNFLIAAVHVFNNGPGPGTITVTDSKGNTWTKATGSYTYGSGLGTEQIWYCENCAAGSNTVTATCGTSSSNFPGISIAEYSGMLTSSSFDAQNHGTGTGTSKSSGNVTATGLSDLLIALSDDVTGGSTETPGAGWTLRETGAFSEMLTRIVSPGTYAYTSTMSGSVTWGAYVVAFKGTATLGAAKPVVCIMQ